MNSPTVINSNNPNSLPPLPDPIIPFDQRSAGTERIASGVKEVVGGVGETLEGVKTGLARRSNNLKENNKSLRSTLTEVGQKALEKEVNIKNNIIRGVISFGLGVDKTLEEKSPISRILRNRRMSKDEKMAAKEMRKSSEEMTKSASVIQKLTGIQMNLLVGDVVAEINNIRQNINVYNLTPSQQTELNNALGVYESGLSRFNSSQNQIARSRDSENYMGNTSYARFAARTLPGLSSNLGGAAVGDYSGQAPQEPLSDAGIPGIVTAEDVGRMETRPIAPVQESAEPEGQNTGTEVEDGNLVQNTRESNSEIENETKDGSPDTGVFDTSGINVENPTAKLNPEASDKEAERKAEDNKKQEQVGEQLTTSDSPLERARALLENIKDLNEAKDLIKALIDYRTSEENLEKILEKYSAKPS